MATNSDPPHPDVGLPPMDSGHNGPRLTWEQTRLHKRWKRRAKDGYANDFIIAVTPSSKTGVSGTGKTTLAVQLAKHFDLSDDGFSGEDRGTVDAAELAYSIIPNADEGEAIVFDESQGSQGAESLNKRRGMKEVALDAVNGILANRDNRNTLIIVAQQLSMLDKNLLPIIDAWILIRKDPNQSGGPLATHHTITVNDYNLRNPNIKTPGIEEVRWQPLALDDPDYIALQEAKHSAREKSTEEKDQSNVKYNRDDAIRTLHEENDLEQKKLADAFDLDQSSISRIVGGKQ